LWIFKFITSWTGISSLQSHSIFNNVVAFGCIICYVNSLWNTTGKSYIKKNYSRSQIGDHAVIYRGSI